MKLIVLIEGSKTNLDILIELARNTYETIAFTDTEYCDEETEHKILFGEIDEFLKSEDNIMFIRFSGREIIAKNVGDEFSEMVVVMSYNKYSKYYTECPVSTFLDLTNSFKKETIKVETIDNIYV